MFYLCTALSYGTIGEYSQRHMNMNKYEHMNIGIFIAINIFMHSQLVNLYFGWLGSWSDYCFVIRKENCGGRFLYHLLTLWMRTKITKILLSDTILKLYKLYFLVVEGFETRFQCAHRSPSLVVWLHLGKHQIYFIIGANRDIYIYIYLEREREREREWKNENPVPIFLSYGTS